MKFIQNLILAIHYIIVWFSGKKTSIGTFCLLMAMLLAEVVVGIWHADGAWIQPTIKTLNWIGIAFGGVGLLHKGYKSMLGLPQNPNQ